MNKMIRLCLLLLCAGFLLVVFKIVGSVIYHNIFAISYKHSQRNSQIANEYIKKTIERNSHFPSFDVAEFTWNAEHSKNNFKYYNAFVMIGLLKCNDYYEFVKNYYNDLLLSDGTVNSINNSKNKAKELEADTILIYYPMYKLKSENKKYSKAIETAYNNIPKLGKLEKCGNNYRHKVNNDKWAYWQFGLDGLYSIYPFLAKHNTDDENYKNIFERMDWVANNMILDNGLYSHGATKDGKLNNIVWLRGVGWYVLAQMELLDIIKDEKYAKPMKKQLARFFDGMIKYQDYKTGMWKNVVYPNIFKCNRMETSGSLMMSYALVDAYTKGYVTDKKYFYAGLRAFNGVMDYNYDKKNGILGNIYRTSNVKNTPEEYCDCKEYVYDEAKGFAALILSAHAIDNALKNDWRKD